MSALYNDARFTYQTSQPHDSSRLSYAQRMAPTSSIQTVVDGDVEEFLTRHRVGLILKQYRLTHES
jgi:hypothetical protein